MFKESIFLHNLDEYRFVPDLKTYQLPQSPTLLQAGSLTRRLHIEPLPRQREKCSYVLRYHTRMSYQAMESYLVAILRNGRTSASIA